MLTTTRSLDAAGAVLGAPVGTAPGVAGAAFEEAWGAGTEDAAAPAAGTEAAAAGALADCVLGREEGRLVAVENLPLVPQKDHGETKYHPQDGAADVVHDGVF